MIRRELGYFEALLHSFYQFGYGFCQLTMAADIEGDLPLEYFLKAVENIYTRLVLLRCVIIKKNNHAYFSETVSFADISIAHEVLPNIDLHSTNRAINDELHQILKSYHSLWRIKLFSDGKKQHTILITLHHAIADALSGMEFIYEILDNVNILKNGKELTIKQKKLLPAIEKILPGAGSYQDYIKYSIPNEAANLTKWKYYHVKPLADQCAVNIIRVVDATRLQELKKRCYQHEISINSAINAALVFAMLDILQLQEINVLLLTPVNVRKSLQLPAGLGSFGCYIETIRTFHNVLNREENFWKIAQNYHQILRQRITEENLLPKEYSLSEVEDEWSQKMAATPHEIDCMVEVTNLGVMRQTEANNDLKIKHSFFATVRTASTPMLHVMTINGQLNLSLGLPDGLLTQQRGELFLDKVIKMLRH